ncbi:MAG: T9SS type A sorting domain-containing protein [Bacteroidota bacterium]
MKNDFQSIRLFLLILFSFGMSLGYTQTYQSGNTYFDNTGFVEYRAGNLPIIISVPHGGYLEPDSIPNRNCNGCSYLRDSYTQEIGYALYDAFFEATGCYPHLINNLLHRRKFDANRPIGTAADGNALVKLSWFAYHELIDSAKAKVMQDYGKGIFLDLHGHAHDIQRIELGYLLSRSELQLPNAELNTTTYIDESSIKALVESNLQALSHSDLLRGDLSFGTLLENKGLAAVPGKLDRFPLSGEAYFSGGYNTDRHSSKDGGQIDGIQIEMNQNIRFDEDERDELIGHLLQSIIEYVQYHYFSDFSESFCKSLTTSIQEIEEEEVLVYPNPAQTHLFIRSKSEKLNVEIYNILGQKVKEVVWTGETLNLNTIRSGSYIIVLKKGGRLILAQRLMIN